MDDWLRGRRSFRFPANIPGSGRGGFCGEDDAIFIELTGIKIVGGQEKTVRYGKLSKPAAWLPMPLITAGF